jgi:hypothetical protein
MTRTDWTKALRTYVDSVAHNITQLGTSLGPNVPRMFPEDRC